MPRNYSPDPKLWIGASWYPEMWPETEWAKDIARMKEIHFNAVRVYEFAWARFEPAEGKYDFDWAIRVLDLCHEAGIDVQIGTPTAAPPAWLTTKYPEVLGTRHDGQRKKHGKRKHYNHHSKKYRELSAGIVRKMVEVFKDHPALHSWQIDNEMAGHDQGDETQDHFRQWLRDQYGSIDKLNELWGLDFWSQKYDSFDQIPLCLASVGSREIPERNHPSLILAIARFQNNGWTSFIKAQCDIIREGSDKPITTNMVESLGMHWFQHNDVLDRVGHSLYRDMEHYKWNIRPFDRMRAEKPTPYWFLETAPNWSGGGPIWNIHMSEDGIQAVTWMSIFLGGSMILYWQWRQHWAGQEMNHGTHVTATGKWRPNKDAWQKLGEGFRDHGPWLNQNPPPQAEVGLIQSNEAGWTFSIDPLEGGFKYAEVMRDEYHVPLAENHIWRDLIRPDRDFTGYKVLIAPLMPMVSEATRERLKQWVADGGYLILGPITGTHTTEFTIWKDQEYGGFEEIMGAENSTRFTPIWIEDRINVEFTDGNSTKTKHWCEAFSPTTGEAIAFYRGGYGDGHAAAVKNSFGKGTVLTLGCALDQTNYIRVVKEAMAAQGVSTVAEGDPDTLVIPRANLEGDKITGYAVLNYTEKPQKVKIPAAGKNRLKNNEPTGPEIELAPLEAQIIEL